jgi:hypothetical protein
MSKQMIGRLFVGSVAAFVGSILLAGAAVMVAIDRDVFIMNGPDVVGVRSGTGAWAALTLGVLALLLALASAVAGFVSWLGALAATGSRTDKSWFIVLLVLGLLSIGFLATLIYLVAGPPDEPQPAAFHAVGADDARLTPVAH